VPVQVMAEALVRRLGGWPHARLITAAHVDAALGEGAAQTAFEDVAGCLRLRSWLNQLEGRRPYLVLAAHRDDDVWAARAASIRWRWRTFARETFVKQQLPQRLHVAARVADPRPQILQPPNRHLRRAPHR
jgi:hypothetical protein